MKVLETTIGSSIIPTYWRRFRIISPLPSKRKHFSACGEKRELNSEGDKRTPPEGCDTEGGAVAKPEEKNRNHRDLQKVEEAVNPYLEEENSMTIRAKSVRRCPPSWGCGSNML